MSAVESDGHWLRRPSPPAVLTDDEAARLAEARSDTARRETERDWSRHPIQDRYPRVVTRRQFRARLAAVADRLRSGGRDTQASS